MRNRPAAANDLRCQFAAHQRVVVDALAVKPFTKPPASPETRPRRDPDRRAARCRNYGRREILPHRITSNDAAIAQRGEFLREIWQPREPANADAAATWFVAREHPRDRAGA